MPDYQLQWIEKCSSTTNGNTHYLDIDWGWLKTVQQRHGILTCFLNIKTRARYCPNLNDKIRRADQKLEAILIQSIPRSPENPNL